MKTQIKIISLFIATMLLFACSEDAIELNGLGEITGKVVKQGANEPIENVKISTSPSSSTVFTNTNGEFIISSVPTGDYSVQASKDGLLTSFEGVSLIHNQSVTVVFEMLDNTTTNQSPSQANLLTPEDNSENLELEVTLTWEATDPDNEPLMYTIELRNDRDSNVIMIEDIEEATHVLSGLNYGTQYFWQVGVSDGVNDMVWSTTNSFTTTSIPNQRYLYTRTIGSNEVIFSGDLDEDDNVTELQLTMSTENSWRPRKNTTIGLVAYLKSVGAQTHIFTMLPDGSENTQVTNTVPVAGFNLNEMDFSWSSSGEKLLYTHFDKLYSINKDGSGLTLIYQTLNGDFITECVWSNDMSMVALKTNNINGYEVSVFTIDMNGTVLNTLLDGVQGAAGGLDISVDNTLLLYTHDVSGFENETYRQLNTHIYLYNLTTDTQEDLSSDKPDGFIDIDPRFSPNESQVICTHTSNDGLSEKRIISIDVNQVTTRNSLFSNAYMPDWE